MAGPTVLRHENLVSLPPRFRDTAGLTPSRANRLTPLSSARQRPALYTRVPGSWSLCGIYTTGFALSTSKYLPRCAALPHTPLDSHTGLPYCASYQFVRAHAWGPFLVAYDCHIVGRSVV